MKRVLVLGDQSKGGVCRLLATLRPWLEERCVLVDVLLDREAPIDVEADLIVVLGGDGSILSAARRMASRQLPTLGINMGKLGFLAEVRLEHVEEAIEAALRGELEEERRLLVECSATQLGAAVHVLNDVVVQRGSERGMVTIGVRVGGAEVAQYVGDGLIVATPVGSTAYSLASGGPILAPNVEALVLTPLASHALPVRPLVVPADQEVELSLVAGAGRLILDGQCDYGIELGERVVVRPSQDRFRLLSRKPGDFFEILRKKFGWAGSPHYAQQPSAELSSKKPS